MGEVEVISLTLVVVGVYLSNKTTTQQLKGNTMKIRSSSTIEWNGIHFRAKYNETTQAEDTKHLQAKWTVKLSTEYGSASFKYSMGAGIENFRHEIEVLEVLHCLLMDYNAYENNTEESFIDEFGYSIAKGKPVWQAVVRNAAKMERLFPSESQREELSETLQDMGY